RIVGKAANPPGTGGVIARRGAATGARDCRAVLLYAGEISKRVIGVDRDQRRVESARISAARKRCTGSSEGDAGTAGNGVVACRAHALSRKRNSGATCPGRDRRTRNIQLARQRRSHRRGCTVLALAVRGRDLEAIDRGCDRARVISNNQINTTSQGAARERNSEGGPTKVSGIIGG